MKKIIHTSLFIISGILLSFWDSAGRGIFLSLSLSVCLSLFGGGFWVAVCAIFGGILDMLNYSFPFFLFIYLYISLGCVWIKSFLFKINFILCVFFYLASVGFACLVSGEFTPFGFVLNTVGFLAFYGILKGIKFEKNYKI